MKKLSEDALKELAGIMKSTYDLPFPENILFGYLKNNSDVVENALKNLHKFIHKHNLE